MMMLRTAVCACFLLASPVFAMDQDTEVDYLLDSISSSECIFIRNGKRHDAQKAAAHLRMKYKRGRRYATSTEKFIERLATKSSITRKPYMIECPGSEPQPSGAWLTQKLESLRSGNSAT